MKPKAKQPALMLAALFLIGVQVVAFVTGFIAIVCVQPAVMLASFIALGLSFEFGMYCLDKFRLANGLRLLDRETQEPL